MAGKPSIQWYPGDWFKAEEVRACSPATRGIWFDVINYAFNRDCYGSITGTVERLARQCGASVDEMEFAIKELEDTNAADVSRSSTGDVTLTCRRLKREQEERENTRKRVKLHRARKRGEGGVTHEKQKSNHPETRKFSRARAEEEEEEEVVVKNGSRKQNGSPREDRVAWAPSESAVMDFFGLHTGTHYGGNRKQSAKSGELFFHHYEARDWLDEKDRPVRSWQSLAKTWMLRKDQFETKGTGPKGSAPISLGNFREVE